MAKVFKLYIEDKIISEGLKIHTSPLEERAEQ